MPIQRRRGTPNPGIVLPEVFSARELAEAAGVPPGLVRQLIIAAEIPTVDGELVAHRDAVAAVQALRRGQLQAHLTGMPPVFGSSLLSRSGLDPQSRNMSVLMSTVLHTMVALLVALLTTTRLTTASDDQLLLELPRLAGLVFVAEPGPGGGGGGGGLRMPVPPPSAERKGTSTISSPVPERLKPRRVEPVEMPEPPPPLDNEPLPPIFAPLVAARADTQDVRGLLTKTETELDSTSQGPGDSGGVGDGGGTGVGEGVGAGVGPGSGGGAGGGPYRPGSGIVPPRLLFEEQPDYTEEARRKGIEGEVLLEIIVRSDGSVSDVRVLRRLGYGLDERAVQAVRQWQFAAAERFGTPVDVLVEVTVEYRLR